MLSRRSDNNYMMKCAYLSYFVNIDNNNGQDLVMRRL